MTKWRYLVIRSLDPASCYVELLELYPLVGFASLIHPPRLVAMYDDVLVIGVPRDVARRVRAAVALLDGCYTVKVVGTSRRARAVAASIRNLTRAVDLDVMTSTKADV
ncbi:hypothetical protein [Pyrobaculum ferrireducens]|uniref:Uncharacterized protein n=1 Tax=Pyrobaculum ferrireducens TaxID=1104324 RepID=G7VEG9_9CREN|nr:hypothetical protein [Pyrobaculum ferrireducens]AET31593.1 hypothetical protein P186_0125 [Pyrobaculum ferrireducens]